MEGDIDRLRAEGLDDRAIVDANQVVAYFNYVNRVADGLGVELSGTGRAPSRRTAVLVVRAGDGNGGGGLVAARHLANAGASVAVVLSRPPEALAPVARAQHRILLAMGIAAESAPPAGEVDLVLDALLGYSQTGPPAGHAAALVEWTRARRVPSLDNPSGLGLAGGRLHEPHVEAEATLTLAAPKEALRQPSALGAVGALFLGDLSIPKAAHDRLGVDWHSPFGTGPVIRITGLGALAKPDQQGRQAEPKASDRPRSV